MDKIKRTGSVIVTVVMIIILVFSGLTGCQKEQQPEVEEKKIITLWHYWDMSYQKQALSRLIDEFNQSQDEIVVETRYIPDADFKKELALSIYEETMPDLALVDSSDFRFFQESKSFVDLKGRIGGIEEYMPEALAPCTEGEEIYGLPFGVNCVGLLYNKEMLKEAGCEVPATWEEFYETAKVLTKDGVYGYIQPTMESEESVYAFLPVFWSMGGDVDNLMSEESRAAFSLMRQMAEEGIISRQCDNLISKDLAMQFAKENVAMMAGSSIQAAYIRKQNPELNFGVADIPSDGEKVTVQGGEIFAVTDGKHVDEAVTFLNYISDSGRMAGYMDDFGYLAAKKEILEQQFPNNEICRKYVDIFSYARLRDQSSQWPEISDELVQALGQVVNGEEDLMVILDHASGEIQKIRRMADEER